MKFRFKHVFIISFALLFLNSCDIFRFDDGHGGKITESDGFLYLGERQQAHIYMLDSQLNELERWELYEVTQDSSLQGLAFDGEFLWASVAGQTNELLQLDLSDGDINVVNRIQSPPDGSGIIRDLAWDGSQLWAVNSGSSFNEEPPAMYRVNVLNGNIEEKHVLNTPEPRGMGFIPDNEDVYGRSAKSGYYYGDVDTDKFHILTKDRKVQVNAFDAPEPPESRFRIFPTGITHEMTEHEGIKFWTVNSSLTSDYLFRLDREGQVEYRFELPYERPGPIVHTTHDVREATEIDDEVPPSLWAIAWDTNYLYKFTEAGVPVQEWNTDDVAPAGSPQGVTFDGEYIWLSAGSDDHTFFKVDTSGETLEEIRSIPAPSGGITRDIIWHDGSIWSVNSGNRLVSEVDPENGDVIQSFGTQTDDPRSITFVDDNGDYVLYSTDRESRAVYKHTYDVITEDWSTDHAFDVPVPPGGEDRHVRPTGISWDGENFWINNSFSRASELDYVMKVNPDGELLEAFQSLRPGADLLNGLQHVSVEVNP